MLYILHVDGAKHVLKNLLYLIAHDIPYWGCTSMPAIATASLIGSRNSSVTLLCHMKKIMFLQE
jgi:hypothetical protein